MNSEVVFCTYDSPTSIGGPFSDLGRLLPALRKSGVNCRVIALTHYGGTGPLIESLRQQDFQVHSTDCHDSIYDQIRWILSLVHDNPPAVFVPNFVTSAMYASHWLKKAGATTVGIIHSDDKYYRAIQNVFVCGKPAWALSEVVCVSEEILRQVLASSPRQTNAVYIPYGVNVPKSDEPKSANNFKIAYVGRLVEEQKRISHVTKALIAACRELSGVEAVIYGDGPDRNAVESMIAETGSDLPIQLMGSTSPEDVAKGLSKCHAIILLSDYEGLPIALLEGMASSCVAICRHMKSGIPQLIEHQKTGFIVGDDVSDFVETIRKLQSDRELTRAVAVNGKKLISNLYSHEKTVQKWIDFLTPHLSTPSPPSFRLPRKIKLPPPEPLLESTYGRPKRASKTYQFFRYLRRQLGKLKHSIHSKP
jgi:colanic acid/amylovoran biosynthesis glycosyltransferase